MKTRNENWFDTNTEKPLFGVQAKYAGVWRNVARDGKPALFHTKAERDKFRAELINNAQETTDNQ